VFVGFPLVEGFIMVLVEAEFGSSPIIEEVVVNEAMLVRVVNCKNELLTSTTGRIEPLGD
jgi:hypothetical protein